MSPSGGRPCGKRGCSEAGGTRTEKPAGPLPSTWPPPTFSAWPPAHPHTHSHMHWQGLTHKSMCTVTHSQMYTHTHTHTCTLCYSAPLTCVSSFLYNVCYCVVADRGGCCIQNLHGGKGSGDSPQLGAHRGSRDFNLVKLVLNNKSTFNIVLCLRGLGCGVQ